MSTNLRKAQKHMQRATELLNPESQLGFGGPDGVATRKRKREAIEQAQGSQEPIQCGICLENITPEDGSPLHACHPKYEDIKDTKEHWFHSACLRPWINAGNPCPLCNYLAVVQPKLPQYTRRFGCLDPTGPPLLTLVQCCPLLMQLV